MRMFGQNGQGARSVATFAVVATVLYVIAFATGTGIFRPIAGTLMLIAIVWMLIWVSRQYSGSAKSSSQLGVLLAMVSLTIGGILGVFLGLFIANGSVPGLSDDVASSLAGAHPPAMLIGYLVLAGAAVVHWLLNGPQSLAGRIVMWALFVGGVVANLSFILDVEALVQVATVLEVAAIVTFTVHMWSRIKPSAWAGQGADNFARFAAIFLVIGVALLVYVVQLFMSGELDPETGAGPIRVLTAFDHAMFVGVMTNALFAIVGRGISQPAAAALPWVVNGAVLVFLVGLVADSDALIRVGAPVMGVALLYGIYLYLTRLGKAPVEPVETAV
jgi:hypothetical protein